MPDAPVERPGRNEPCHCGSGNKYKRCCLAKDDATERQEHAAAVAEAPSPTPEHKPGSEAAKPQRPTDQPWKRGGDRSASFRRFLTPRKRGGG